MLATVSLRGLFALSFITSAVAPCFSLAQSVDEDSPLILEPIRLDDYYANRGLRRRDAFDVRNLDLQKQTDLIYGTSVNDEEQYLAHMKAYAPDGLRTASMELFEPLTTSVDCNADDGIVSLTFVSKEAFDYAVRHWAWINNVDDDKFILIMNHDGCGPDKERQAYIISQVKHDQTSLTTYLTAKPEDLVDALPKYNVDFGFIDYSRARVNRLRHLQKRDSQDSDLNAYSSLNLNDPGSQSEPMTEEPSREGNDRKLSKAQLGSVPESDTPAIASEPDDFDDSDEDIETETSSKSKSRSRSWKLRLEAGSLTNKEEIIGINHLATGLTFTLFVNCDRCYVKGDLGLAGHLEVDGLSVKKFIMEASPSNFRLRTVLENAFRVPWESERFPGAEWVNKKWELFKRPIPGHGIDIPGVLSVGLLASVWVGVEMTVAGGANFTWGFEGAIPESAKIMVDVLDRDKTYAEGFEGTTFNPILQLHSFEGTVRCSAGVSLKLTFGISLKKVGDYETGIRVLLPDWSSLVTGISNVQGACRQESGASMTGILIGSYIGYAIDVTVQFGHDTFMYPIIRVLGYWHPMLERCFDTDFDAYVPARDEDMSNYAGLLGTGGESEETAQNDMNTISQGKAVNGGQNLLEEEFKMPSNMADNKQEKPAEAVFLTRPESINDDLLNSPDAEKGVPVPIPKIPARAGSAAI